MNLRKGALCAPTKMNLTASDEELEFLLSTGRTASETDARACVSYICHGRSVPTFVFRTVMLAPHEIVPSLVTFMNRSILLNTVRPEPATMLVPAVAATCMLLHTILHVAAFPRPKMRMPLGYWSVTSRGVLRGVLHLAACAFEEHSTPAAPLYDPQVHM